MPCRAQFRLPACGPAAVLLWGLAAAGAAAGAAAADARDDATAWQAAFAAAGDGDWQRARRTAEGAGDPLLREVLAWADYRRDDTGAGFAEIARFIDAHPDWPHLRALRTNAERRLGDGMEPRQLAAWFRKYPPRTGRGALMHAAALQALGEDVTALVRDTWTGVDFEPQDSKLFYRRYRRLLRRADHVARLDRLIWSGRSADARRMLPLAGDGHRALGEARLALLSLTPGVDGAIRRVPQDLRDDAGLWFARLHWRRRKGRDDSAAEVLLDPPPALAAATALPHLEDWYAEREVLARRALARGRHRDAYRLVAGHGLTEGVDFAEAEFMAGWIAHAFLGDHVAAAGHFGRLHAGVRTPISRARGAFWSARAAAALGDAAAARAWYGRAAGHPNVFYGQHAAAALGRGLPPPQPSPAPDAADLRWLETHAFTPIARRLAAAGASRHAAPFLYLMGRRAPTAGSRAAVARLAQQSGRPGQALAIARRGLRDGEHFTEFNYPLIDLPPDDGGAAPEPALLLALVRKESSFEADAESPAGARGLTQLMPGTARDMARRLDLRYRPGGLTGDRTYNLRLGRAYLAAMLARFDGAYPLALAGYNAGPGNVARWLRDFGDPRGGDIDMLDWIESIPFDETRNYVQRVLEAVPFYRRRLGGRPDIPLAGRRQD